jgi:flagellar hook-associated protein 3 FlgL
MRISTATAYDTSIGNLQRRQSDLVDAQTHLTSGKRVLKASDDPANAARAERALASEMRTVASQRSVEASRVQMVETESALGTADGLLQQAREALVGAGNASFSDAERAVHADKLQGLRDALFAVANRSDGSGGYLFGGQGTTQPPFVNAPAGVQYLGASGQTLTDADTGLPLNTDGAAPWMNARTGNGVFVTAAATNSVTGAAVSGAWIDGTGVTNPAALFPVADTGYRLRFTSATNYTVERFPLATPAAAVSEGTGTYAAGSAIDVHGMGFTVSGAPVNGDRFELTPSASNLSVFSMLDSAIADLRTPGRTTAQRAQGTADALRNIDAVMAPLRSARAAAGEMLNRIDSHSDRLAEKKLNAQSDRSSAEDLDMVAAIADYKNKETGYDAALKSYAVVQKMSLFDYLNG